MQREQRSRYECTPLVARTPLPTASAIVNQSRPPGGGATPVPDGRVDVQSSVSHQYYTVAGTTTADIFASIDQNGPRDDNGVKGSGLTSATWSYRWQPEVQGDSCVIQSMTIVLDIVVTLPQHENVEELSPNLSANWNNFVIAVSNHEQQHVDINLAGAETIRQKMEDLAPADTCDDLQTNVDSLWNDQQKAIQTAQNNFHAQDDARIAAERAPIQKSIDNNTKLLDDYSSQIADLDKDITALDGELTTMENQLDALKAQMETILGTSSEADLAPDQAAQYEDVRRQYNEIAPQYNLLVDQYNSLIAQRSDLANKHDSLLDATNQLVEAYNWAH